MIRKFSTRALAQTNNINNNNNHKDNEQPASVSGSPPSLTSSCDSSTSSSTSSSSPPTAMSKPSSAPRKPTPHPRIPRASLPPTIMETEYEINYGSCGTAVLGSDVMVSAAAQKRGNNDNKRGKRANKVEARPYREMPVDVGDTEAIIVDDAAIRRTSLTSTHSAHVIIEEDEEEDEQEQTGKEHRDKKTGGKGSELVDRDKICGRIGEFGRWQRNLLLFSALLGLPLAWHLSAFAFFAPGVNHWCSKPTEYPFMNWTDSQWKNYAIPHSPEGNYEQCVMYDHGVLPDPFTIDPNRFNPKDHNVEKTARMIPCQSWTHDTNVFHKTIEGQWNLVCDKAYFTMIVQTSFIAGILCGAVVYGQFCDRIGRKPVALISACQVALCAVLVCLCRDLSLFIVLRFLVAMGATGLYLSSFVLLVEAVGGKARTLAATAFLIPLSVGVASLSGIAFGLPDWRLLQLAISVPCVLLFSLFWWFPESPRWLLAADQEKQAQQVLGTIAGLNGTLHPSSQAIHYPETMSAADVEAAKELEHKIMSDYVSRQLRHASLTSTTLDLPPATAGGGGASGTLPPSASTLLSTLSRGASVRLATMPNRAGRCHAPQLVGVCPNCAHADSLVKFEAWDASVVTVDAPKPSVCHLVATPRLRARTCELGAIWFTLSAAFYALCLVGGNVITGDVFGSIMAEGGIQLIANLMVLGILSKSGKRIPLFLAVLETGAACFLTAFVSPKTLGMDWPVKMLAVCGKFGTYAAFCVLITFTAEIYPTVLRSIGLGAGFASGALGAIVAPYFVSVGKVTHPAVPMATLGVFAIIAAFLVFLLPETARNYLLPETVLQVEEDTPMQCDKDTKKSRLKDPSSSTC
ncbi:unnamed protein product [Notodromas monacha]|uniref:Major facilitator superfamily (MFS) profile domain-containing protein n=1 Tax=Notodromas monacha TaxID=399045 RepID=A0A7R9GHT6_9CRUS|nr:unnamed protein product [Notodromas monacha]CAG0921856.1 unnamed protein product [Notodromas monacha]